MKKMILIPMILVYLALPLAASERLSVPLGHEAYSVLKSGELRGIIRPLPDVRPFSSSVVITNLKTMLGSVGLSPSERTRIAGLIKELTYTYEQPEHISDVLNKGAYSSYWEEADIGVALGAFGGMEFTLSATGNNLYDARNSIGAYIRSQIKDFASIYMEFGLRLDHLEHRLFLNNDFIIPTEARYDPLPGSQGGASFMYGFEMAPEIALSFLKDNLQIRIGSIQRDWGVGHNNFMISGSARSFEGIETYINFAPWLRYSFIAGSLGDFYTETLDDGSEYFDGYMFNDVMFENLYDNNFSAHRVEVSLPWNFNFGIYESVIYRKRFELGYLNPFAIIMFQQILMGDFDNMLAGIDLEWNWPNVMRLYGAMATTELHEVNPMKFFKHPRNIIGIQGGADLHLPFGQFSSLTFQYTHLSPFFYTHYPWVNENAIVGYEPIYDGTTITGYEPVYGSVITHLVPYINEGQNLGYPLRPSSDEIMMKLDVGITEFLRGDLTVKYQRRSGQYGFNFDTFMVYSSTSGYEEKDFNAYIFEKTLGVNLGLTKKFRDYPITVQGGYLYTMTLAQDSLPTPVPGEVGYSDGIEQPIKYTTNSPWLPPRHTHAVQIGFSIWR